VNLIITDMKYQRGRLNYQVHMYAIGHHNTELLFLKNNLIYFSSSKPKCF
jgi:hypothetical protein